MVFDNFPWSALTLSESYSSDWRYPKLNGHTGKY